MTKGTQSITTEVPETGDYYVLKTLTCVVRSFLRLVKFGSNCQRAYEPTQKEWKKRVETTLTYDFGVVSCWLAPTKLSSS